MTILLYGLEVLPLSQYQLRSLDFVINRLFMKLFRTSDIRVQVVAQCQEEFCFDLPSVQLARRRKKFLDKLYHCQCVIVFCECFLLFFFSLLSFLPS